MTDKIVQIADRSGKASMQDCAGLLRSVQACMENADQKEANPVFPVCKKMIVIALDSSKDRYIIDWLQAGMSYSEMIALLDITKANMIKGMGY